MYSSGILHFMVLSTKEELDERRVDPLIDKTITELLYLKAVQVMSMVAKIFLSRVLTVPRTEHG